MTIIITLQSNATVVDLQKWIWKWITSWSKWAKLMKSNICKNFKFLCLIDIFLRKNSFMKMIKKINILIVHLLGKVFDFGIWYTFFSFIKNSLIKRLAHAKCLCSKEKPQNVFHIIFHWCDRTIKVKPKQYIFILNEQRFSYILYHLIALMTENIIRKDFMINLRKNQSSSISFLKPFIECFPKFTRKISVSGPVSNKFQIFFVLARNVEGIIESRWKLINFSFHSTFYE